MTKQLIVIGLSIISNYCISFLLFQSGFALDENWTFREFSAVTSSRLWILFFSNVAIFLVAIFPAKKIKELLS